MVILYERYDFSAWLECLDVLDVVVDCRILVALGSVIEDFLNYCDIFKSEFTARIAMALHVGQGQVLLHLLKDLGQEDHVLGRVFQHLSA